MKQVQQFPYRKFFSAAILAAALCAAPALISCGSSKPAQTEQPASAQGPQRYHLEGRVVSVESAKQQLVVDHGDIPGFMGAMQMGYSVKDPGQLAPLSAEDQIKADVVVNGSDVYLENIVVTKKAANVPAAKSPAPASSQPSK